jgi:hypothetical protein
LTWIAGLVGFPATFLLLSSTGLSDVIPVEPFARGLVMLEQLAGLSFVAGVVSYLVALTVVRQSWRS